MPGDDLKAILRRFVDEVWNGGNLDAIEQFIAPSYVRHDPGLPMELRGPEGVRQVVTMYRTAFPDLHLELENVLVEGDRLALRLTGSGTQRGPLPGIPPTGRKGSVWAMEIHRFENGKIVEQWVLIDNLTLLQQLGAIPAPSGAGTTA